MHRVPTLIAAVMFAMAAMASPAAADNAAAVRTFYDFLSNPGSKKHADKVRANLTADWQSIGDYSGKAKGAEGFIAQLGGFSKRIPDLTWKVEEMLEVGDRVIVRGRATGTPNGPLFGVDGKGKAFEIMSIDIHTMKDGKVAKTYHVEDWSGALRQLKGK
ncbi:MAG: ester cyclase [Pseudomonadota bacterium]